MKKAVHTILLTLLSALLVQGCSFREVFVEGTLIQVNIHDLQPRANGTYPELFEAVFYDAETGKKVSSDFIPASGGQMHLKAGNYKYVIYNFDLESTYLVDGTEYEAVKARTGEAASEIGKLYRTILQYGVSDDNTFTDEQRGAAASVLYEPDAFYVATGVVGVPHRSNEQDVITLDVSPKDMVHTVTVSVEGITGAQYVGSVSVFLANLSGSVYASSGKTGDDKAAFYFNCAEGAGGSFHSSFRCFGFLPGEEYEGDGMKVTAYVLVAGLGGQRLIVTRDVTELVRDISGGRDVNIVVHCSVNVPEPESSDDGFAPTLDDWFEEEVPVPIGQ